MSFFDDITALSQARPTLNLAPEQRLAMLANNIEGGLTVAGDINSAMSHLQFGETANAADQFQAQQLRQNAGQAQAASQIQAYGADLQGKYAMSTALARAAAGGGGASDPTVVNLIARNAGVSAYQKAVALYQGDERARLDNMQADAKEFEGANIEANSRQVATGNLFKAPANLMTSMAKDSSLYQRFARGILNQ